MAKVNGPLMSVSASGKLAKQLIFSKRKSGQQVRAFHRPKKPRTGLQITQRQIIGYINVFWRTLTDEQKKVYTDLANSENKKGLAKITGFNYFIRLACSDLESVLGITGFFPMNEKTGNTILDVSGNKKNGQMSGGVSRVVGRIGNAVYFDGSSSKIALDNDVKYIERNKPFSFTSWIKLDSFGVNIYPILITLKEFDTTSPFVILLSNVDNILGVSLGCAYDWGRFKSNTPVVNMVNKWSHVCITYNGGDITKFSNFNIYFNGKLCVKTSNPGYALLDNANCIGATLNGGVNTNFVGKIDNVCMFNRLLSANEIFNQMKIMIDNKKRQVFSI